MKPIVVILTDQQRWDSVGVYGNHNCTPHLDTLAREGTLFSHAFTPQPVCGPARACIQTGLYATQTGCFKNDIPLPEHAITLGKLLGTQGYETAYIGKWHLASSLAHNEDYIWNPPPIERRGGYSYWMASDVLEVTSNGYEGFVFDSDGNKVPFDNYRVDSIKNFAIEYLHSWHRRREEQKKPFFLIISFIEPHQQNDTDTFQGPPDPSVDLTYSMGEDLQKGCGNWEISLDSYMQCCHRIDSACGEIFDTMKQMGVYEDSLLIYTSDHGCHFKTRGPEYKRTCHDASIRIPLMIRGGAFTQGGVREDFASLIDLFPTITSFAEIDQIPHVCGRDLHTPNTSSSQAVYIQISETSLSRAIRTDTYCYCITNKESNPLINSHALHYEEAFLYDVIQDPAQQKNLIHDNSYRAIKETLRTMLINKAREAGEWIDRIDSA